MRSSSPQSSLQSRIGVEKQELDANAAWLEALPRRRRFETTKGASVALEGNPYLEYDWWMYPPPPQVQCGENKSMVAKQLQLSAQSRRYKQAVASHQDQHLKRHHIEREQQQQQQQQQQLEREKEARGEGRDEYSAMLGRGRRESMDIRRSLLAAKYRNKPVEERATLRNPYKQTGQQVEVQWQDTVFKTRKMKIAAARRGGDFLQVDQESQAQGGGKAATDHAAVGQESMLNPNQGQEWEYFTARHAGRSSSNNTASMMRGSSANIAFEQYKFDELLKGGALSQKEWQQAKHAVVAHHPHVRTLSRSESDACRIVFVNRHKHTVPASLCGRPPVRILLLSFFTTTTNSGKKWADEKKQEKADAPPYLLGLKNRMCYAAARGYRYVQMAPAAAVTRQ